MIDDHIICPHQSTEGFSFEQCYQCGSFDLHMGTKQGRSPHCRKQKSADHKRSFESAFLLYLLRMPYKVVVDGQSEEL